ncbi:MAG: hypothetical protein DMF61_00270 [Blastocatellia bacterium AA13]|nr:MAG: hypothetical protein DMF61_00270 [Blastocatellia bacterium AA13]
MNDFVATKLNLNETQWEIGSPRRILETGSRYCGHLSDAMATLLETGGYTARVIHLSDGLTDPHTHSVTEVWYGDGWHLYDPTYGFKFISDGGRVLSYNELRLDRSRISETAMGQLKPKVRRRVLTWMPAVYASGYHHFYYIRTLKHRR